MLSPPIYKSAYVRIGIACVLVLAIGRWGMLREMDIIQSLVVREQISQVKSNAERTVVHIEQDLARNRDKSFAEVIDEAKWLQELWYRTKELEPIRAFRAVLDNKHQIVLHSNPLKIGGVAVSRFYERPLKDRGVQSQGYRVDTALLDDESFMEIRLPIRHNRKVLGYYTSGLSKEWIANKVVEEQRGPRWTWMIVITAMAWIVVITGILRQVG
jgi:hypothetical protein